MEIKTDLTLESLSLAARERKPFTLARYGDGEWISMLQLRDQNKKNCDWHYYYPEMGEAIRQTLIQKPAYRLGLQNLAVRLYRAKIEAFLAQHSIPQLDWCYSDVLHKASQNGNLHQFAMECRRAVWIGPEHLGPLAKTLQAKRHIVTALYNVWETFHPLLETTLDAVKAGDLVLVSCGMPAKVLIHQLHKHQPAATIIDVGAVWDPYVGVASRKYMHGKRYSVGDLLRGKDES
jgi:hypothetical protein